MLFSRVTFIWTPVVAAKHNNSPPRPHYTPPQPEHGRNRIPKQTTAKEERQQRQEQQREKKSKKICAVRDSNPGSYAAKCLCINGLSGRPQKRTLRARVGIELTPFAQSLWCIRVIPLRQPRLVVFVEGWGERIEINSADGAGEGARVSWGA